MYNYTDKDKEEIKRNPLNRHNCRGLVETVRKLAENLKFQEAQPAKTPKEIKDKNSKVSDARSRFEERSNILTMYKEVFPEQFVK